MTMNNKPSVTVLTTVYNGLPFLQEAIESTLSQTFTDFTYLIIDDASPDKNVIPFIKSYTDPRIKLLVNEENLGVSNTFNKALEIIDTEYVVRLDQDDVSLPNRLEEQINFLHANKHISIVCSWEHTIDSEGKKIRDWKSAINNYGEFIAPILLGICPIWHPSIAFRLDDMINAGGFNEEYIRAEDFEVTARLALNRYNAAICNNFHLLQRQHNQSQSVEFENIQFETTSKIQEESLSRFLDKDKSLQLSSFLRLDLPNSNLNKNYLLEIYYSMKELFKNLEKELNLNKVELQSVKKIIYLRVGFGILLFRFYSFLPKNIPISIFLILSPMFNKKLKAYFSKMINSFSKLKYIFNK
jgi:glycosyltransferase involved in cell wall biosynthesis